MLQETLIEDKEAMKALIELAKVGGANIAYTTDSFKNKISIPVPFSIQNFCLDLE